MDDSENEELYVTMIDGDRFLLNIPAFPTGKVTIDLGACHQFPNNTPIGTALRDVALKRYEVPIVYRGQDNYVVLARNPAEAEKKARALFEDGTSPSPLGNEWETIEFVGDITRVDGLKPE